MKSFGKARNRSQWNFIFILYLHKEALLSHLALIVCFFLISSIAFF